MFFPWKPNRTTQVLQEAYRSHLLQMQLSGRTKTTLTSLALAMYRMSIHDTGKPTKIGNMAIISFKCSETKQLFHHGKPKRFVNFAEVGRRKLRMIDFASQLDDLRIPPKNRLEALKGDRAGQHSIRVNDQYRVCFVWLGKDAANVEIIDYH